MPIRAALKEFKTGLVSAIMNSTAVLKGQQPKSSPGHVTESTNSFQQPSRTLIHNETRHPTTPSTPQAPTFQPMFATPHQPNSPLRNPTFPSDQLASIPSVAAGSITLSAEDEENAALIAEIERFKQQNAQLLDEYSQLLEAMKKQKINSFEDLANQDKELFKTLLLLMEKTEPMPMEGHNVGLFGITSTGKSTLINVLLGKNCAATGTGETTTTITPYEAQGYILWDFPGRNDEVSYFSMQYISFLKGLSKRFIVIQSTMKENSSLMKLLDANGLKYTIIVNKFDLIDDDERDDFQNQVRSEVRTLQLKNVQNIYFVSAKKPNMFPDWLKMVGEVQSVSI